MRIAYFDCFHGAAGDMLLASLFDVGLDREKLEEILADLPLMGYTIEHRRTLQHHISGSMVQIALSEPGPLRRWQDIRMMLEESRLPDIPCEQAIGAFARLARAEASVHGVDIEDVHFHEVGALDSIIDIVGVCVGLELLGIERVYSSPLPLGMGWVTTQHGDLPVPAPATLEILAEAHAPGVPGATSGEVLTPTAAALLCELAHFEQPPIHIQQIGYGFGHKPFDRLNGLRVWIGKAYRQQMPPTARPLLSEAWDEARADYEDEEEHVQVSDHQGQKRRLSVVGRESMEHEAIMEMRCNLDDATGEIIAYTIEQLLKNGALDAWATPIVMKKGRPAMQLACLAYHQHVEELAHLILRETPTLGVRWETMERYISDRRIMTVSTPWGTVRLKQKLLEGKIVASAPEYDDCAMIARTCQVPLAEVYAAALRESERSAE